MCQLSLESPQRCWPDCDLNFNYIGNIERGEKLASLETIVRLARAFKMTGCELLSRAGI